MQSVWNVPGKASALNPPSFTSGEPDPPPPIPPDPPDPSSPLSPVQFPPLSSAQLTGSKPFSSQKVGFKSWKNSSTAVASGSRPVHSESTSTTAVPVTQTTDVKTSKVTISDSKKPRSTVSTTVQNQASEKNSQNFLTFPPKSSSPILTNKASSSSAPQTVLDQNPSLNPNPSSNPTSPRLPPLAAEPVPSLPAQPSVTSDPILPPPLLPPPILPPPVTDSTKGPTLVEKIRAAEDKTLTRLAPVTVSPTGRPRVVIPDSVFKIGAELHKDFIICYFNGKAPPFNQIQSVFNHLWGKGQRLEIHNNPLNRTTLVRIPSEYLRNKILEKNIWYVGDSMFHTAQWSSEHSSATPPLKAIKIWAHLTGVPLDLRYNAGLSLVAGLVGEPKETDDFTKNMVSLTVSHVKVEVDLTKPLPDIVEFERESGEVVEVTVHYPWVPPTCTHCHELGHIIRNCLHYTPPPPPVPPSGAKSKGKNPSNSSTPVSKASRQVYKKKSVAPVKTNSSDSTIALSDEMQIDKPTPSLSKTLIPPPDHNLSPDPRPSLKRSRSSPTLSPPLSTNPNPFLLPPLHPPSASDLLLALNSPLPKPLPIKKPSSSSISSSTKSHYTTKNSFSLLSSDSDPSPKKPLSPSLQLNITSFFSREPISDGGDPPSRS